jgi:ATP-dependent Lon protease
MTGELTLTGRVLPIGGLKEKVLGAVRAGIKEIILPMDNEADIEDIPADVQERLTFHLVETLDEVVSVAFVGEPTKGKKAPRRQRPRKEVGGEAVAP